MTVRRTSEHEAILHLRLVAINAAVAVTDAVPAVRVGQRTVLPAHSSHGGTRGTRWGRRDSPHVPRRESAKQRRLELMQAVILLFAVLFLAGLLFLVWADDRDDTIR